MGCVFPGTDPQGHGDSCRDFFQHELSLFASVHSGGSDYMAPSYCSRFFPVGQLAFHPGFCLNVTNYELMEFRLSIFVPNVNSWERLFIYLLDSLFKSIGAQ